MGATLAQMPRYTGTKMQTATTPPEGQRFSSRYQPESAGRTGTSWLRKRLSKACRDGDRSTREAIADHLIEVATSWQIIHLGKEYDVASGRDAVAAATLLYQYDMGRAPVSKEEARLALAEHFRKVEADRFQFARELLGEKIKSMTPVQLAEFFSRLAPDVLGFLKMAEQAQSGAEHPQLEASPPEHAAPGEPVPARPADSPDPETARPGDDAGKEPDGRQDARATATRDSGDPTP